MHAKGERLMPVFKYLDLSTAHVTEPEMEAINERLAAIDEATPRVIPHDYGAWVNVMEGEDEPALIERYPNLAACLDKARERDCKWINFDQDADTHDGLPTFDW